METKGALPGRKKQQSVGINRPMGESRRNSWAGEDWGDCVAEPLGEHKFLGSVCKVRSRECASALPLDEDAPRAPRAQGMYY